MVMSLTPADHAVHNAARVPLTTQVERPSGVACWEGEAQEVSVKKLNPKRMTGDRRDAQQGAGHPICVSASHCLIQVRNDPA